MREAPSWRRPLQNPVGSKSWDASARVLERAKITGPRVHDVRSLRRAGSKARRAKNHRRRRREVWKHTIA
jgi:hypothetical protein